MTSVFLSYVREDVDKARTIAAALERAGHSVWWDRQIKGGAQYSAEIEAALTSAEKVVVLWSAEAVKSAWVRDEAAFGRDRGNLIPVAVDGTEPPLGFRQFQTIELSHWKGRTGVHGLERLLEALDSSQPQPISEAVAPRRWLTPPFLPGWSWIAIAVAAIALVGGGWWWASRARAHPPTVAIEGANDPSREIASELATRLSALQSSPTAFQLISGAKNADLILQIDARETANNLRRDVTMLSGANGSILWSASLKQPPSQADDLSQQLAVTSERVLICALEALADRQDRIDPVMLKQYLNGCSRLEMVYGLGQYDPSLANAFAQVAAKAPHFNGAWAKLLQTETEAARNADPPQALIDSLRTHIAQAEKLGLKLGELYAAKAALLPTSDFLGTFALYDEGIRAAPDDPYLYRLRSERLQAVGRMNDSVNDAGQAFQLDPLSPAYMDTYISALAYAGRIDAAYDQLRKAESIWPAAGNLKFARYRLDLRFGDPKEALMSYRTSMSGTADPAQESFLQARIDPTAANIERAINEERIIHAQEPREIFGLMQALGQFGRKDEAIDVLLNYNRPDALGYNAEVLFRPALRAMWRDPRAIAAAAHVGFLHYWEKSGKWPDFCFDPTLPYNCKKEAAKYRV